MLERDADRKADRKFPAASALGARFQEPHDPQQGARLVRAFLKIADPKMRLAVIDMVERMGSQPAEC
jgi:hypothetical protein